MADTPDPAAAAPAAPSTPSQPAHEPAAAGPPAAAPAADPGAPPAPVPAAAAPEPAPAPAVPAATPAATAPAKPAEPAQTFPPTAMDAARPDAAKPADTKVPDAKAEAAKEAPKAAEGEKKTDAAAQPAVAAETPITYEFKFPEDIKSDQINAETLTAFKDVLGGEKVKPEAAQKLLDLHTAELRKLVPAITERLQNQSWDTFRQTTDGWLNELKSDETVGGTRFDTAMRTIATVIEQYLPPERQSALRDRLRATGMGNDVNLALLLHTFGAMLGREAAIVPATEPRQRPMNRQERGLARYNGSTPAQR
jgi:hypothetical protein